MSRTIPKQSAALILSQDPEDGYLDLQVIGPEPGSVNYDGYLLQVADLAAKLLEQNLFSEDDEDEESVELELLGDLTEEV